MEPVIRRQLGMERCCQPVSFLRGNNGAIGKRCQSALEGYVTVGRYQSHLRRTCQIYRKRRDAMILAINRHLPASASISPPQGGLFGWLRLPNGLSAEKLLPLACKEGVSFAPGARFFPHPVEGDQFLRLNSASQPPENTDEGIKRLGKAMRRLEISGKGR